MAYTPHTPQKYEKVAATAATLLEKKLVVPTFFAHQSADDFKGGLNDAYSITVPGVLPARKYGWRNDRSTPIVFDTYTERKVTVNFGAHPYSAVALTDEQKDFDLGGSFGRLVGAQTDAVRRQLENESVEIIENAPYEVTITAEASADIRKVARAARRALRDLNAPDGEQILLLGSAWEEKALADDALALASSVGERRALGALERAVIGQLYGLTVVVSDEIDPDAAYAFVRSAFVFVSGVPTIPQSVAFGASASTSSALNLGLRWIQDFDLTTYTDRSAFDLYAGFRYVDDPLVTVNESNNGVVSEDNHFVRAVEIVLGGAGNAVTTTTSDEEVSDFSGITLAGS
jgi:hypothetical protein